MAKFHFEYAQRSAAWAYARLGIPTASEFHKIITPGGRDGQKPKPSSQAPHYLHRLLAEFVLGEPIIDEDYQSTWMEQGSEIEPEAIRSFEFITGRMTKEVGFVTTDDELCGASPDRLVLDDSGEIIGTLEVKSVAPQTQIALLLGDVNLEQKYRVQCCGQVLICEAQHSWIYSYNRKFPPVIYEATRNDAFIDKLQAGLKAFCEQMLERRAELERRYGPFERRPLFPVAAKPRNDFGGLGVTMEDVDAILAARGEGVL